jgi:hypothetical protein
MALGKPYWVSVKKTEQFEEVSNLELVRGQKNSKGELFTKKFELAPLGADQTNLASMSKEKVLEWVESKLDMTTVDDNIATDKVFGE